MSTDLNTVTSDTLVEDAARLMLERDVGSVLAVDGVAGVGSAGDEAWALELDD